MTKVLKYLGVTMLILIITTYIGIKLFWPKDWTVNAPMLQFLTGVGSGSAEDQKLSNRITLPPGFHINIYADNIAHARGLYLTTNGDILVSQPREGKISLLLADKNGDGKTDGVKTLLTNLNYPYGMDVYNGNLYIAETDGVVRVPFDAKLKSVDKTNLKRIVTNLPGGGNHSTRTLHFGPDNMMYVSIGSSCNVCIEKDPRRATIVRFNPDGSGEKIFASGLRNTVGFDWQPTTNKLYGVDNGRDFLGDNFPPEEVNQIIEDGFYGWPFLNGDNIPDPDYGNINDPRIKNAIKPVHKSIAHAAPLAILFLTSPNTPKTYHNAALVTHHGSWNRTKKSGYQIVSLHWQPDGSIIEKPFATGFMINEEVFGRPVDMVQAPDGTVFVSDDFTNSIYRISTDK